MYGNMAQSQDQSLESQLRNMIVSNGTQSSTHQSHGQSAFPSHVPRNNNPVRQQQERHGQHHPSYPPHQGRPTNTHHPHARYNHDFAYAQSGAAPDRQQNFSHFHHGPHHVQHSNYQPPSHHHSHGDTHTFQKGPQRGGMQPRQPRQLYQPQSQSFAAGSGPQYDLQWQYLDALVSQEIPLIEMTDDEVADKDAFRLRLEELCRDLTAKNADKNLPSVTLASFGSLSSGFASKGSDMDLAIVTDSFTSAEQQFSLHEDSLPRALEQELLHQGFGARLLTRTRVPIIKICETPSSELLEALREERQRWAVLPDDEKYTSSKAAHDDTPPKKDTVASGETDAINQTSSVDAPLTANVSHHATNNGASGDESQPIPTTIDISVKTRQTKDDASSAASYPNAQPGEGHKGPQQRRDRPWTRERVMGPLDFPKDGVGIQCDINFFNPLGIWNTKLLRCYSKCDPRVRPMILFIKAWAKRRKINSSYSGTLSSYGYVLMVLHYLVNVAQPPVLPNLQHEAARTGLPSKTIDGWEVRFFDDEAAIEQRASSALLTRNQQSLGALLLGFFQYFASTSRGQGFIWMQDVLSLRTHGGVMKKDQKGWTGAKTEVGDNQKEVRHRYLFAIEDPFEVTHNVARTVTHNGIVAIRDEFRRSWRIIQARGRGLAPHDGDLFAELEEGHDQKSLNPPKADVAAVSAVYTTPITNPSPAAVTQPTLKPTPVQEYSQAFPQLGGKQSTNTVVPVKNKQPGAHSTKTLESGQPKASQFKKNNKPKFVSLDSMNKRQEGAISGEQARAHLMQFKRQQQNGGAGTATSNATGLN